MGSTKTILKRATAYALAFVMAFSMLFTGNNVVTTNAAATVTKLTVKKSKVTIDLSKSSTKTVKVTVKGSNKKFTAKSSKKSVATVKVENKTVVITGKKKGTAKITVTTKGKNSKNKKLKKTIKVTVKGTAPATTAEPTTQAPTTEAPKPEDKYNSVKITTPTTADGSTPSVNVGTSTKLTAAVDATDADKVVWTSSNPSVAVVSKDGTVTGVTAGTTEAIATMNGKEIGRISITISSVAVTGVTLDHTTLDLTVGKDSTLIATVVPSNATVRTVKWESNNEKVAKVDANGKVSALGAGNATITVKTDDKAFTATCEVVVKEDTKEDVDNIVATVSNSLDGYDNTVLAGTQAKIDIKVTKNGAPYGDDSVGLVLKHYSGYDIYSLSKEDVETKSDGTASVYIRMDSAYKDNVGPILPSLERQNYVNRGYASYTLEMTSGGASITKEIPISFAQVLTQTNIEDDTPTLTVDNDYDPTLKSIEVSDSMRGIGTAESIDGHVQEYVIDQQVSSDKYEDSDHKVYLNASPLLILPETVGEKTIDTFDKDVNLKEKDYSVYAAEDKAAVLSNVPGGLEYVTLTFTDLKLSEYTRLVIRAYKHDTEEPLIGENGLIQEILYSDTQLGRGNTQQVGKSIFSQTRGDETIDLKFFIESAGQVDDDSNVGFAITHVKGTWKTELQKPYEVEVLKDAVTWKIGRENSYTNDLAIDKSKASDYLGSQYSEYENCTFTISYPAFPETGDAIITAKATDDTETYFLYPTMVDDNTNIEVPAFSTYGMRINQAFKVTDEQIEEISVKKVTDEFNRLVVDSNKAGQVQVTANVAFGPIDNTTKKPVINYELHSSVQWSPIPEKVIFHPVDFYALAGQKITARVYVKDSEGNGKADAGVTWNGINNVEGVTVDKIETTTGSKKYAQLELTSAGNYNINDLSVTVANGFSYELKIVKGTEEYVVSTGHAALHWVKPGIFYENAVYGTVPKEDYYSINTSNSTSNETVTVDSNYPVGTNWIVGTQVRGPQNIVNISNIKIAMSATSTDGITAQPVETSDNGVYTITNTKTGSQNVIVTLAGLIDESQPIKITVADVDEPFTCIGTGAYKSGPDLTIPVKWGNNGANLSLINNNPKFHINNNAVPYVYARVLDDKQNPVSGTKIIYTIKDEQNEQALASEIEATTDSKGYVLISKDALRSVDDLPKSATTYLFSAYIDGEKNNTSRTTTIEFVADENASFELTNDPEIDVASKKITLTFDTQVDKNIIKDLFFKVTTGNTTNTISDVQVQTTSNIVVITLADTISADSVVTIKATDASGDEVYHFLNTAGVLFQE